MGGPRVVFLELNELSPSLVDRFIAEGRLSLYGLSKPVHMRGEALPGYGPRVAPRRAAEKTAARSNRGTP